MSKLLNICKNYSGIREDITDAEEAVILDLLQTEFKTLKPEEIGRAFKMNASGKYWETIEAYQTFSPIFVGKVLNQFKKQKQKQYLLGQSKENGKLLPEGETKGENEDKDAYDRMLKQYKEGEIKINLWYNAFKHAEKEGKIKISNEAKIKLWKLEKEKAEKALKMAQINHRNTLAEQIALTEMGLKASCAKKLLIEYWG